LSPLPAVSVTKVKSFELECLAEQLSESGIRRFKINRFNHKFKTMTADPLPF
jgi:hypothetical protein